MQVFWGRVSSSLLQFSIFLLKDLYQVGLLDQFFLLRISTTGITIRLALDMSADLAEYPWIDFCQSLNFSKSLSPNRQLNGCCFLLAPFLHGWVGWKYVSNSETMHENWSCSNLWKTKGGKWYIFVKILLIGKIEKYSYNLFSFAINPAIRYFNSEYLGAAVKARRKC